MEHNYQDVDEVWMEPYYKLVVSFLHNNSKGVWLIPESSLNIFREDHYVKGSTAFLDINNELIMFDTDMIFIANAQKIGQPYIEFIAERNPKYARIGNI